MANKILIVAPHPDDEVLGCSGVMKKSTERGDNVYVLIITKGDPALYPEYKITNIRKEACQAHDLLGVKETRFLDFIAPKLDTTSHAEIARAIDDLIHELTIDTLFLPHRGDIHIDHRIVFSSGLVGGRPIGNYSVNKIYTYETLSETEWAPPFSNDAFIPTHFVDITYQMKSKLAAMRCYKSQLKEFPDARSLENMEALAKYRGATVGFKRAEAFMTIRTIER